MMRQFFQKLFIAMILSAGSAEESLAAAPQTAAPSPQEEQQILAQVQDYLTNLTTFTAHIMQQNPDGKHVTGRIFMDRKVTTPYGKLRLEYTPPAKDLVIVDGERFILQDLTTRERSDYDVSQTPAGFLLKKKIRFGDDVTVKNILTTADQVTLTLVAADDQSGPSLTLKFDRKPFLILKEWVVVDPQGNRTAVQLSDIRIGMLLDDQLFRA